ncbi:hypothetical protein EDEG_01997 [Edhazardia aedis USNM 41457]|uniref:Uncharacterized protein n=1 Tax=Edhazardia aedis (strain USNM 41457) TaxID=1003232 RepID=J9DM82_EDHAE|nr:hypothetical protein EDEG_01997 [Edhazardia aedis USNM 41457]|eukprot:EJW03705.1 hypothetical protein EDEG_01997 [Edhazardia aedis USNM 41457]
MPNSNTSSKNSPQCSYTKTSIDRRAETFDHSQCSSIPSTVFNDQPLDLSVQNTDSVKILDDTLTKNTVEQLIPSYTYNPVTTNYSNIANKDDLSFVNNNPTTNMDNNYNYNLNTNNMNYLERLYLLYCWQQLYYKCLRETQPTTNSGYHIFQNTHLPVSDSMPANFIPVVKNYNVEKNTLPNVNPYLLASNTTPDQKTLENDATLHINTLKENDVSSNFLSNKDEHTSCTYLCNSCTNNSHTNHPNQP